VAKLFYTAKDRSKKNNHKQRVKNRDAKDAREREELKLLESGS